MIALAILVVGLLFATGCQSGPRQASSRGAPVEPTLPGIGEPVKFQGWEVTLLRFAPHERPQPSGASATLVIAELRLRNIQNRSASFTPNDFIVKTADRRSLKPATATATLERGLTTGEELPPGGVTERRVAFEVPSGDAPLILEALEIEFSLPAPGR